MSTFKEKISVIIPVYNEGDKIIGNMIALKEKFKYIGLNREFEYILVDDGSTDDTFDRINEIGVCDLAITMIINQGKGAAFKRGLKYAWGDYIVLMDSDAQIDAEDLYTFFNIMMIYRADAVIGNKRHAYSQVQYTPTRWIVSNVYNIICRILFGFKLRDTQCGFKLFKKEAIHKVMKKLLIKRFAFDLELIVAMREQHLRIADAPVRVREQQSGGSITRENIYMTAKDTLAVWYRKNIKGWYKP